MRASTKLAVLLAAAGLVLSGCGDDPAPDTGSGGAGEGARDVAVAGLEPGPPGPGVAAAMPLPQHPAGDRLGARPAHPMHQDKAVAPEIAVVGIARQLPAVGYSVG